MGAWGEGPFENDAALDAVAGHEGYQSLAVEGRAQAVIAAFLAGSPHRYGYGEPEAFAACEFVAQALLRDESWRELGYAHAVEEEMEILLGQDLWLSVDDVEQALAVVTRLEEEERVARWREPAKRRQALHEAKARLERARAKAPAALPSEAPAGQRLRPSDLSAS